ncbi:hypothetical protein MUB24_20070 [Lederbergia sp. NSJ-179]|uniref:hypothetical protein n=1 Tax=Lederbergia sp. NSJ-179 TaxID=2931402 RepID=UPI001FD40623|nr:hypothetical protein [Lederbergia sp. NSJ-179]MCJ7843130.1 hypothetical protein [Lederbergia sp. NSJ-179]
MESKSLERSHSGFRKARNHEEFPKPVINRDLQDVRKQKIDTTARMEPLPDIVALRKE